MTFPIEISYRAMTSSDELNALIHEKAEGLARLDGGVTRCRVVLGAPHRHQQHGHACSVHIDLHLPGEPLVITHDPGHAEDHEDMERTIRDAFQAAHRRLRDRVKRDRERHRG